MLLFFSYKAPGGEISNNDGGRKSSHLQGEREARREEGLSTRARSRGAQAKR